jgi:ankyrin repeat protein
MSSSLDDGTSTIPRFTPTDGQWELIDDNIQRVDPRTGRTILHNYCKFINTTPIDVFKFLLETKNVDITSEDDEGNQPLFLALDQFEQDKGDVNALMYLLHQGGIDINFKGEYDYTLFHIACQNINSLPLKVFQYLIDKGADINTKDDDYNPAFHYAFLEFDPNEGGDVNILTYLLNHAHINIEIKAEYGDSLLHTACSKINQLPLDVFKLLIETKGANVNVLAENKSTPLHRALIQFNRDLCGDVNILTYLFSQRIVNAKTQGLYGSTLLHLACQNIGKLPIEVFKCLIEANGCDINLQDNINRYSPLHFALLNAKSRCDAVILTYLLSRASVNLNVKDKIGRSLLHLACVNINALPLDLFKYLIETKGFDPNTHDFYENTPLFYAFNYFKPDRGAENTLNYLLNQESIDVNSRNKSNCTLLHIACKNVNTLPLDVFKYLIEVKGADINMVGEDRNTPILFAFDRFDHGDVAVLTYLIGQKDLDANSKDQRGRIILHRACEKINTLPVEAFQCLIETKGADVNVFDDNKNTPLYYALHSFQPAYGGDITALTYLLNHKNVNINLKGREGRTLLHWASHHINTIPIEVFKCLIEAKGVDINQFDEAENKNTPVFLAIIQFDPQIGDGLNIIRYLLRQESLNVNIKGQFEWTLLQWICWRMRDFPLDIFTFLIENKGMDINTCHPRTNNTPVHSAFEGQKTAPLGDLTVLTYLLNQDNLNVNIKGAENRTLLHLACEDVRYPRDIFELLIETKGANLNALNSHKNTPLHILLYQFEPDYDHLHDIILYLLEQRGIDVNVKGKYGLTAVHFLCQNIKLFPLEIFKLLIQTHGGNINIEDNHGNTPLHYAIFNFEFGRQNSIIKYLFKQKSLDVNMTAHSGHSLLHLGYGLTRGLLSKVDSFWSKTSTIVIEKKIQEFLDEVNQF